VRRDLPSLILLLLAFLPTLVWIVDGWFLPDSYFSHGPLLVLVCLWFLRDRRKELLQVSVQPSRTGLALLLCFLLVHLASQTLQIDSISGAVFVPAIFAWFLALRGRASLRIAAAPLGALFIAVPMPVLVTGRLAYELKHVATAASVALGNLFGMELTQEGAKIRIPGLADPMLVGDACSGLSSLVALTALGYVFAVFISRRGLKGKALLVLLAVPVALAANFTRITVLAAIAKHKGLVFATGIAHDISGYLIYLWAIVLLLLLEKWLPGRPVERQETGLPETGTPETGTQETGTQESGRGRRWTRKAVFVVILGMGLPAAAMGFYRPVDPTERVPTERLSEQIPGETRHFKALSDHKLSERWYALLGTRDVIWRDYEHLESGRRLTVTALFHGRNWKSVHPPEVCLQASGFEIEGLSIRSLGKASHATQIAILETDYEGRGFLSAYLFGGPGFTTPFYGTFFLQNLPSAIFRSHTVGFLLRVDVEKRDLDQVQAETLLASFLAEFLPYMKAAVK
jgi:exosortase